MFKTFITQKNLIPCKILQWFFIYLKENSFEWKISVNANNFYAYTENLFIWKITFFVLQWEKKFSILHLISVFMLEIVMKSLSNISFALIFPILFDGKVGRLNFKVDFLKILKTEKNNGECQKGPKLKKYFYSPPTQTH